MFVSGPVNATVLATAVWPPAGIVLSMVTEGVGSLLRYIQKSTEPPPVERTAEAKGHVFSNPGIFATIVVNIFLGMNSVAIDVIALAFADELGLKPAVGPLLPCLLLHCL